MAFLFFAANTALALPADPKIISQKLGIAPVAKGELKTFPEIKAIQYENHIYDLSEAPRLASLFATVPQANQSFEESSRLQKKSQSWLYGGMIVGGTIVLAGATTMALTKRPIGGLVLGGLGALSYGFALFRSHNLKKESNFALTIALDHYNANRDQAKLIGLSEK